MLNDNFKGYNLNLTKANKIIFNLWRVKIGPETLRFLKHTRTQI